MSVTIGTERPLLDGDVEWEFIPNAAVVRGGLACAQRQRTAMMSACTRIRTFSPASIPGLLQAPAYIRAVMNAHYLGLAETEQPDPDIIAEALAVRERRAQAVLSDSTQVEIVMGLAAVRAWFASGLDVLAAQIRHLIEATADGALRFGVLADRSHVPFAPSQGFVILDDRQVRVDHLTGELVLRAADQVRAHGEIFEALAGACCYGPDARRLLEAELRRLN